MQLYLSSKNKINCNYKGILHYLNNTTHKERYITMNKQQVLDSLQQLIPYKKYNKSGEEIVHIKEVIGPERTFNDRSICSLISAIHELTDDPIIKELALEAIWMSGRMHKSIREAKGKDDIWNDILD
jgi:hypothetical protein